MTFFIITRFLFNFLKKAFRKRFHQTTFLEAIQSKSLRCGHFQHFLSNILASTCTQTNYLLLKSWKVSPSLEIFTPPMLPRQIWNCRLLHRSSIPTVRCPAKFYFAFQMVVHRYEVAKNQPTRFGSKTRTDRGPSRAYNSRVDAVAVLTEREKEPVQLRCSTDLLACLIFQTFSQPQDERSSRKMVFHIHFSFLLSTDHVNKEQTTMKKKVVDADKLAQCVYLLANSVGSRTMVDFLLKIAYKLLVSQDTPFIRHKMPFLYTEESKEWEPVVLAEPICKFRRQDFGLFSVKLS